MLRYTLLALVLACGSNPGCGGPETASTLPEPIPTASIQAVHEWGLVSVGPNGVELAAGPGMQRAPSTFGDITIDKPVLYVHADAPGRLQVEVTLGDGMSVAEHFPPAAGSPLRWDVEVTPGECTTPRTYTGTCNSVDGYCETHELALYETRDAACLTQGGLSVPLLFYRLRADTLPALPLEIEDTGGVLVGDHDGSVTVRNAGLVPGASIWRVTWDGSQVHATRALAPALGEPLVIARATQGNATEARPAMRQDLADLGLTRPESEAFMRAWDSALFGADGSIDYEGNVDGVPADVLPADVRADSPVDIDSLTSDETIIDRSTPGAPRITDALLYWLPPANIEAMAALSFQPEPEEVSRAILVRVDVR